MLQVSSLGSGPGESHPSRALALTLPASGSRPWRAAVGAGPVTEGPKSLGAFRQRRFGSPRVLASLVKVPAPDPLSSGEGGDPCLASYHFFGSPPVSSRCLLSLLYHQWLQMSIPLATVVLPLAPPRNFRVPMGFLRGGVVLVRCGAGLEPVGCFGVFRVVMRFSECYSTF